MQGANPIFKNKKPTGMSAFNADIYFAQNKSIKQDLSVTNNNAKFSDSSAVKKAETKPLNLYEDHIANLKPREYGADFVEYEKDNKFWDAWREQILAKDENIKSTLGISHPDSLEIAKEQGITIDKYVKLHHKNGIELVEDWLNGGFISNIKSKENLIQDDEKDILMKEQMGYNNDEIEEPETEESNNNVVFYENWKTDFDYANPIANIFFQEIDTEGALILNHYLNGSGEDILIEDNKKWTDYVKKDEEFKDKTKDLILREANNLESGKQKEIKINVSGDSANFKDGEGITGHNYLHGSNATVGGYKITGIIEKDENGNIITNLQYKWNDVIDPFFGNRSDEWKESFARIITFAKQKPYNIRVAWSDNSVIGIEQGSGKGWLN